MFFLDKNRSGRFRIIPLKSQVVWDWPKSQGIGVLKYKMKLQYKQLTPDPEFPRGRILSIDTDEQF